MSIFEIDEPRARSYCVLLWTSKHVGKSYSPLMEELEDEAQVMDALNKKKVAHACVTEKDNVHRLQEGKS